MDLSDLVSRSGKTFINKNYFLIFEKSYGYLIILHQQFIIKSNKKMKKILAAILLSTNLLFAQTVAQKLDAATKKLLASSAAYSANLSLYVADESGNLVYEYQGNKGLSTASTQKIFTAACVIETLGKDYQYTTSASYTGTISGGVLDGNLVVYSTGDPSLGTWRFEAYKPENFLQKLVAAIKNKGISKISGNIIIDDSYFDFQNIPGGWPWNDMGNYYGAGVWGVNWRENQFDININGKDFKNFNIDLQKVHWVNELKTGGISDQSLIFTAPHSDVALINGMLPAGKTMTVSGATPNPPLQLAVEILQQCKDAGIDVSGKINTVSEMKIHGEKPSVFNKQTAFFDYKSPTLDKLVYWFFRKSVNLYGETFIKTLAKEKRNEGNFKAGVDFLQDFWKSKGINSAMINFADGSGLSPQNYVSARAEVQALLYAKKQSWFSAYYDGFPVHENGMKMKSGTMKDTKSFAGFHTSKSGKNFVFSIIINNYQGSNISDALLQVLKPLQ